MHSIPPLSRFSPRALNFIASMVYGQEARVVLSHRVARPLVVALDSRTILADPDAAGFYDVFLGARLLRRRREADRDQLGDRVDRRRVRRWAAEEDAGLRRDFPGLSRLDG